MRRRRRRIRTLVMVATMFFFLACGWLPNIYVPFYIPPVQADPDWLSGWGYRVQIDINSKVVDSDLSSFPVLIHLSNDSSGIYGEDTSFVFDEVGANSKKIAVTIGEDVETYVEVEAWNPSAETAWLWANVTATSAANQTLYLYYDSTHADNSKVGFTNEAAAEEVWDSNYVGVWHMAESSSPIIDSTSSGNNGTEAGDPTYSQAGKTGDPAVDLDGTGDYFNCGGDGGDLDITGALTVEACGYPNDFDDFQAVIVKGEQYHMRLERRNPGNAETLSWLTHNGSWNAVYMLNSSRDVDNWYYFAGTYDGQVGGVQKAYWYDDSGVLQSDSVDGGITSSTYDVYLGDDSYATGKDYDGLLGEARVSNTDRGDAWIKASFYSYWDKMDDFGSQEVESAVNYYYPAPSDEYISAYNETVDFSVFFNSTENLDWSGFSWNISGSWSANETVFNNAGVTEKWSNISKTLTENGVWVAWKIFCNDTAGAWNYTLRTLYSWELAPTGATYEMGRYVGGGRTQCYYSGKPTGGEDALYIAYNNYSSADYMVTAYNMSGAEWVGPFKLTNAPSADLHWQPAIGVLPDGRLIYATGYASLMNFTLSVNSAQTESNLTKLLTEWTSWVGLRSHSGLTTAFHYPDIGMWSNTLTVFGRDGFGAGNDWTEFKWVNDSQMYCYAHSYTQTDLVNFTKVGGSPYLNENDDSYVYSNGWKGRIGYWSFRVKNDTYTFLESFDYTTLYLQVEQKYGDNSTNYIVSIYDGSLWLNLTEHSASSDWTWTTDYIGYHVGSLSELESLRIKIYQTSDNKGPLYVRAARVRFVSTGFQAPFLFVANEGGYNAGFILAGHQSNDGKFFFSGDERATGYVGNAFFMYSDDNASTWKLVDGTTITHKPIRIQDILVFNQNATGIRARNRPIYDLSNSKPYIVSQRYSLEKDRYPEYVQITAYSATLGSSGSWNTCNMTLENSTQIGPFNTTLTDVVACKYSTYYERLMVWLPWNQTRVTRFVAMPNNNTIFRATEYSSYDVFGCGSLGSMWGDITNSPEVYETQIRDFKLNLGNKWYGASNQTIDSENIYGCKFTAAYDGNLTDLKWRLCPNQTVYESVYGNAAIYNSTYYKIGETDSLCDLTSDYTAHRWAANLFFVTPIEVYQGQDYWLCFRLATDVHYVQAIYDAGSVNQSFWYSYPAGGYPDTLPEGSLNFEDRKYTIVGCEAITVIRGSGHDFPIAIYIEAEASNFQADVNVQWEDNIGCVAAKFYWNESGSWLLNGTASLEGKTDWANFTRDFSEGLDEIFWYMEANDTSGNWGNTSLQVLSLLQEYSEAFMESVVVSESYSFLGALSFRTTETVTITELSSKNRESLFRTYESSTVTESSSKLGEWLTSLSESVNVGEGFSYLGREVLVALSESVQPESAMNAWASLTGFFQESLQPTGAMERWRELVFQTQESCSPVASFIYLGREALVSFAENVVPSSSFSRMIEALFIGSDTVNLSEAGSFSKELMFIDMYVTQTEAVLPSSLSFFWRELTFTGHETLSLASEFGRWVSLFFTSTETVTATSQLAKWGEYVRYFPETVVTTDQPLKYFALARMFSESVAVSESYSKWISLYTTFSETVNIVASETMQGEFSFTEALTVWETIQPQQSAFMWRELQRTFHNPISVGESAEKLIALMATSTESVAVSAADAVWRGLWFTTTEAVNMVSSLTTLGESLLTSVEFLETVIVTPSETFTPELAVAVPSINDVYGLAALAFIIALAAVALVVNEGREKG